MSCPSWQTDAVCHPDMAWLFTTESKPNPATLVKLAAICSGCPVFKRCAGMGARESGSGFFAGVYLPTVGRGRAEARIELARRAA